MRRRLGIENHFVKISTMMQDYGLPEKIDEEEISLERMVEAEKFINQNEHYISYKATKTSATSSLLRRITASREAL